jgi:hypothetical protein
MLLADTKASLLERMIDNWLSSGLLLYQLSALRPIGLD